MGILSTLRGTAKCPECGGTGDPTGWLPTLGYDPMMRQFVCRGCRTKFFHIVPDGEQLLNVKERVKALQAEVP
ncbi:hypothetical protein ES703_09062 [subsurface metagenome]